MRGKLSTVGLVKITAKTQFEDGYLYLMWETGNKYVKIGRSNNPDRRKGELSKTNMPYDIFLLRKIKVSDYKKAEKAFHKIYEEFRFQTEDKRTEYFDLNPMELNYLMLIDRGVIEDICSGRVKWPSGTIKPLMKHYDRFLEGPDSPYAEMESARQAERISDLSSLVDQLRADIFRLEGELTRLKVEGVTGMSSTENRVRAALRSLEFPVKQKQPEITETVGRGESAEEYRQQCPLCGKMDAARFTSIDEPNIENHRDFPTYESRFHNHDKYDMLICENCNSLFSQC